MPDAKRIREDLTRELGAARLHVDDESLARCSRDSWVI
jgi:hypothetical protein